MGKRWFLLIVLLIVVNVSVNNVSVNSQQIKGIVGSCEEDNTCNAMCENGDSDCLCTNQKGVLCNEKQECYGTLLKNWEGGACCFGECVNSSLVEKKENLKSLTDVQAKKTETVIGSKKITESKEVQYSIGIFVLAIVLFAILVPFILHYFRKKKEDDYMDMDGRGG